MTAATLCPTCGTEALAESARFCHACGSPLLGSDTPAEYKQVTVLFADVVHSMDIAAAVGAERLREIMTDLVNRAAGVVQRYGGTVGSFDSSPHSKRVCLTEVADPPSIPAISREHSATYSVRLYK